MIPFMCLKKLMLTKQMFWPILLFVISNKMNFKFQPKVCDGGHDLTKTATTFSDVAIVSNKGNNYGIHFSYKMY